MKAKVYQRKNGDKVAVFDRIVSGQLRYTAHPRSAIDGRRWYCIYDNEDDKYLVGKYKTRTECESAIAKKLEKGLLAFVPYPPFKYKTGKHKFAVDVTFYKCHCVEVEATSREEAQKMVEDRIRNGEISPDDREFEYTDDYEAEVSGEELKDGNVQYF